MNDVSRMQTIINECNIHAERLEMAYTHLLPLFPFTEEKLAHISDVDFGFLEVLIGRFAKLQDTLGGKLFPEVAGMVEPGFERRTFIDVLNLLEKENLLKSAKEWKAMRDFRNQLTHEYPDNPEIMVENLNNSLDFIRALLAYWKSLNPQVVDVVEQYKKKFG